MDSFLSGGARNFFVWLFSCLSQAGIKHYQDK